MQKSVKQGQRSFQRQNGGACRGEFTKGTETGGPSKMCNYTSCAKKDRIRDVSLRVQIKLIIVSPSQVIRDAQGWQQPWPTNTKRKLSSTLETQLKMRRNYCRYTWNDLAMIIGLFLTGGGAVVPLLTVLPATLTSSFHLSVRSIYILSFLQANLCFCKLGVLPVQL